MGKDKNHDYTAAERKKREREKMKELGFKRKEYWVHHEDEETISKLIKKKRADRIKSIRQRDRTRYTTRQIKQFDGI